MGWVVLAFVLGGTAGFLLGAISVYAFFAIKAFQSYRQRERNFDSQMEDFARKLEESLKEIDDMPEEGPTETSFISFLEEKPSA